MRGTRIAQRCGRAHERFIPACAGNTAVTRSAAMPVAVHPRVCGEHIASGIVTDHLTGSSPRVRGTLNSTVYGAKQRRFIPACAGNTRWWLIPVSSVTVHPRVCGEHLKNIRVINDPDGSSPRVRGTLRHVAEQPSCQRFIPACAGNTRPAPRSSAGSAVHPRVCGEHSVCGSLALSMTGSSPRVRGTRRRQKEGVKGGRFIPACAGNTRPKGVSVHTETVHPRVCGEHKRLTRNARGRTGSSPRVRGTPHAGAARSVDARFIPACAGNTHVWRDHPCPPVGSSPRVRGTPHPRRHIVDVDRFIPACAGNTATPIGR